jgi:hypothetical protein
MCERCVYRQSNRNDDGELKHRVRRPHEDRLAGKRGPGEGGEAARASLNIGRTGWQGKENSIRCP